jgi:hypothetical protein
MVLYGYFSFRFKFGSTDILMLFDMRFLKTYENFVILSVNIKKINDCTISFLLEFSFFRIK